MAEKVTGIEDHKVERAPSTAYYIPNFISEEEADYLWRKVYAAPLPKWTHLSNRNLQNWGGIPHAKGMVKEDLPEWLERCCSQVAELGVFGSAWPNHVLVNEYTPGQGIMPHHDGPLYDPVVTTISLGSTALLDFYRPIDDEQDSKATLQDRYVTSLLLEPCSLVVLTDLMYTKYLHGIEARRVDTCSVDVCNLPNCATVYDMDTVLQRQTRVSLTIRNVPKVVKFDLLHHVLGRKANH